MKNFHDFLRSRTRMNVAVDARKNNKNLIPIFEANAREIRSLKQKVLKFIRILKIGSLGFVQQVIILRALQFFQIAQNCRKNLH